MILSDFNAISITSITGAAFKGKTALDKSLIKHIVINKFREINRKLAGEFGDHIVCIDHKSWRKDYFPYYKAGRKTARKDSSVDWELIFEVMHEVEEDFKEFFPFFTIKQRGLEADDIIAAFAVTAKEPVCIVSKDGDFNQLHSDTVHQWEFSKKRFIKDPNPYLHRIEKIIKGDKGDGIPNILSDDDTFVTSKRSGTMTAGRLVEMTEFAKVDFIGAPNELKRNWDRNKKLIDLTSPTEEALSMVDIYNDMKKEKVFTKKALVDYFVKNKMVLLMAKMNDFFPRGPGETTEREETPRKAAQESTGDLSAFF